MSELEIQDIEAVSRSISQGLAAEDEKGLALRTVQTALGVSLLKSLNETARGFQSLQNLLDRCIHRFETLITQEVEAETIDREHLFEIINLIQKNQVAFLELQRKLVQSPNKIFADDVLSADEKKLLALVKSFKTPEEKAKFLSAVETAFANSNNNDFE